MVPSKESGGLGLGSLRDCNLSLIVKWWWHLKKGENELWCRVIKGIHNLYNKPSDYMANKTYAGVWRNMEKVRGILTKKGIDIMEIFKKTN